MCVTESPPWQQINKKTTKEPLSLSKEDILKIVTCITGHWLFGSHSMRLEVFAHEYCRS